MNCGSFCRRTPRGPRGFTNNWNNSISSGVAGCLHTPLAPTVLSVPAWEPALEAVRKRCLCFFFIASVAALLLLWGPSRAVAADLLIGSNLLKREFSGGQRFTCGTFWLSGYTEIPCSGYSQGISVWRVQGVQPFSDPARGKWKMDISRREGFRNQPPFVCNGGNDRFLKQEAPAHAPCMAATFSVAWTCICSRMTKTRCQLVVGHGNCSVSSQSATAMCFF